MKTISKTEKFDRWMAGITGKDPPKAAIIAQRIERLRKGLGEIEPVGDGVKPAAKQPKQ